MHTLTQLPLKKQSLGREVGPNDVLQHPFVVPMTAGLAPTFANTPRPLTMHLESLKFTRPLLPPANPQPSIVPILSRETSTTQLAAQTSLSGAMQ